MANKTPLNIACENCDAAIRIHPRKFPDLYSELHQIARCWVAISDALMSHDWTFSDEGIALCPKCSSRDVVNYTPGLKTTKRTRHDKQFEEDQLNISKTGQFNIWLSRREVFRYKMACFFVNQNVREATTFLFKQFTDHVLSGNLREKSEARYKNYLEDLKEKEEERNEQREKMIAEVIGAYFPGKSEKQARIMAENLLKMNKWDMEKTLGAE